MAKRSRMAPGKSRRHFTKHAVKTHRKNVPAPKRVPMRGGIRL